MNAAPRLWLSLMPIPALIIMIACLRLTVDPFLSSEPAWLLPITNTLFVTVVCFIVAYIAIRNYQATGRIQVLLLGCGVLTFGIGGVIAGILRNVPEFGANLNVTVYNAGALVGAIFHFAAAWILLTGIALEVRVKRRAWLLVLGYSGSILFMGLFTMASLQNLIPPFIIRGLGPTPLRQWVLGSADVLFAFSFLIFMGTYLRNRESFLHWYSSALALTSISLTAFLIESSVGSPVSWAGRFSQYLGGIYFLIAIITAARSAQARRTSLDNILTASLSPAEEKFRALAEHSPDPISRFDKELKHIYANPAHLRLYGKPAASVMGRSLEQSGLPAHDCRVRGEIIQTVFETGRPAAVEEYLSTEKGTGFYQSHYVPEYGVDGSVGNVLIVSRDLTERKRAEEERERLVAELKEAVSEANRSQAQLQAVLQSMQELNATLESRVAERTAEVQGLADQLRALAMELTQTEQRERRRLAEILHDHIQQLLVGAQIQLGLIRQADEKTIRDKIQLIDSIMREAIAASRSLAVELSPPILHQSGLAAGLTWLAECMREKHLFKVKVQACPDSEPSNESVRLLLFESVRELLLNAVKHSGVQEAEVKMIRTEDGGSKITVEDQGRGFDPAILLPGEAGTGGFGLFSIQQHLVHLGGRLEIESASGRGTRAILFSPPGDTVQKLKAAGG